MAGSPGSFIDYIVYIESQMVHKYWKKALATNEDIKVKESHNNKISNQKFYARKTFWEMVLIYIFSTAIKEKLYVWRRESD